MLIQEIRFEVRRGKEDLGTFTVTIAGKRGDLTQIRIGCDKHADVRLPKGMASRIHAICEVSGELTEVQFVDLGNRQASKVNGKDATKCALNNGDVIGIGDIEIRVTFEPGAEEPEEAPSEDGGEVATPLEDMTCEELLKRARELQGEVEYLRKAKSVIESYLTVTLKKQLEQVELTKGILTLLRTPRGELEVIRALLADSPTKL